ncbi:hypothetical protein B0H66DRAFT_534636 [Apodospora peruviana]|uniref:Uncharacterized protein n=1 Tax=Apodospora peruviana TaxID=516989 RepID=A0AAE0I172_9PEZI|nr:hypothetical protein B0H66DRAFT_534636 [Apodospora peruviana]
MALPFLTLPKSPILLHFLIESAAAASFILNPTSQLPPTLPWSSPETKEINLILRSYGGLLLSTNLICLVVVLDSDSTQIVSNRTASLVSLALATYHIWPIYRAYSRIIRNHVPETTRGVEGKRPVVLGGPAVHLFVHIILLVGLVLSGCFGF